MGRRNSCVLDCVACAHGGRLHLHHQARDEAALSFLADVRLEWDLSRMPTPEAPTRGATREFAARRPPQAAARCMHYTALRCLAVAPVLRPICRAMHM